LRFAEPSVTQRSSTIPAFACTYTRSLWYPRAPDRRGKEALMVAVGLSSQVIGEDLVPAGIQLMASRSPR
jgi:hypothetical protein